MPLYFIRHGESEWNSKNIFTGLTDVKLSKNGEMEAETAGKLLSTINLDVIFSSKLKRTIETGKTIRTFQNFHNWAPVIQASELNERDYGSLTGKNKDELKKEYGEHKVKQWRRSYLQGPPGGENLKQVEDRASVFFENEIKPRIKEKQTILVVSHGNTIRALFVHLGIKDEQSIETCEIPTGIPIEIFCDEKEYALVNPYFFSGFQIIDSRGFPTLQVQCYDKLNKKIIGKGSSPSGASCGSTEVVELRDEDPGMYDGKSVYTTVAKINELNNWLPWKENTVKNLIVGDQLIRDYDCSWNKSKIGGNTATALSFCLADTGSNLMQTEMYEYIYQQFFKSKDSYVLKSEELPTPMANIMNGGKHSVTGELKIQEFMIFPNKKFSMAKKIQIIVEVYHSLKKILVNNFGHQAKSIGDEGGFCPPVFKSKEALTLIEQAIKAANYTPNIDVFMALDCAASEFYHKETKKYEVEKNNFLTSEELILFYGELLEKHPALKSIEDGFDEGDYEGWKLFTEKYGHRLMIVGDDLFTTNPSLIKKGLDNNWANALLLKVNQIGTISEAIEGAKMMMQRNNQVIVSHRSGETNHAYIVDLAVGMGAGFLKIGSPCRGERVAKFNRLLEIEHNISLH